MIDTTIQFGTRRAGVPHAMSLRRWAGAAFDAATTATTGAMRAGEVALTIRVVDGVESRRLNRTWRGKNKPTNVLSFPALQAGELVWDMNRHVRANPSHARFDTCVLGDLAICAPVVAREAREQHKHPRAHWAHMVVHGVLHLLGYDHENDRDAQVMESREVKILAQFGFANPYV